MKAKLLGATAIATAAIALASPSFAKTYKFQFGTNSGSQFCDGLTITNDDSGKLWTGNHTGSCEADDSAGGFTAKIGGTTYIDINTTDANNAPGIFETFLLVPKTLQWFVYENDGGGFVLFNEGKLLKGPPPASLPAGARASVFKNPKAVDKPVH